MTDYALGQRVAYSEHIRRTYVHREGLARTEPNKVWTGEAYPGQRLDGGEGIIIGKRTLSDGIYDYGWGEEPGEYRRKRSFPAYLVAFDLRRKPVFVLPEHITPLTQEES